MEEKIHTSWPLVAQARRLYYAVSDVNASIKGLSRKYEGYHPNFATPSFNFQAYIDNVYIWHVIVCLDSYVDIEYTQLYRDVDKYLIVVDIYSKYYNDFRLIDVTQFAMKYYKED